MRQRFINWLDSLPEPNAFEQICVHITFGILFLYWMPKAQFWIIHKILS
jgi:hypothetical protein